MFALNCWLAKNEGSQQTQLQGQRVDPDQGTELSQVSGAQSEVEDVGDCSEQPGQDLDRGQSHLTECRQDGRRRGLRN